MYSHLFYVAMWVVCFVLIVPVLIVGVIYVIISNKPAPAPNLDNLETMYAAIKAAQAKDAFNAALGKFKNKYKVLTDDSELDLWLKCVTELGHSAHWDTDAIAKFGQELEDNNPNHAKKIAISIATVLKNKK